MRKIRKSRKKLIKMTRLILAIAIIIIAIVVIVKIVRKGDTPEEPEKPDETIVLPETTYSDLEVINVQMKYLSENNETSIRFDIYNPTSEIAESDNFDVVWLSSDGTTLAQVPSSFLEDIEPGGTVGVELVLKGNLTTTAQIKLIEK